MLGRLTLILGIVTGLFSVAVATPSSAQIAGVWTFPYGEARLEVDNRVNVNGLTPPWIATSMDVPGGGTISFLGGYRNLVWEGRWYFFGDQAPRGIAFRPCAQPHGDQYRRPTNRYGRYRVTFNAAENRFEGVMSNCNLQPLAGGGAQALVGTRNNTFTVQGGPAREPETREVPRLPFNIPIMPPVATPEQQAAIQAGEGERQCAELRESMQTIAWSQGFQTHPCIYNIGDEVEIITLANQTQRPVSVIYRAFHPLPGQVVRDRSLPRGYRIDGGRPLYLRISSRRGLPNQGVPRAGHRYRISFPGDICRERAWMLSILMSDGTETAPIGMVIAGFEQVPLFGRACSPGFHTHEADDFVDPSDPDVARFLSFQGSEQLRERP